MNEFMQEKTVKLLGIKKISSKKNDKKYLVLYTASENKQDNSTYGLSIQDYFISHSDDIENYLKQVIDVQAEIELIIKATLYNNSNRLDIIQIDNFELGGGE